MINGLVAHVELEHEIVKWTSPIGGNCEEELPKKPVGRQSTDRLRKKKNCVKNEQLT